MKEDSTLRVTQVNVGKRLECHDLALQRAAEVDEDVVCAQEPWVLWDWKTTRNHPTYEAVLPLEVGKGPMVVVYVKRGLRFCVVEARDSLRVSVKKEELWAQVVGRLLKFQGLVETVEDIEKWCAGLEECFKGGLGAAGVKPRASKRKAWWNGDCEVAKARLARGRGQ